MLNEQRFAIGNSAINGAEIISFVRRIGRYGCVGLAVSAFYSIAVILGVQVLAVVPTAASLLAFALTLPVGYLMHSRVTFADRRSGALQPMRFALSNVSSFVVTIGGMYWITAVNHDSYLLSIAWNYILIPAINFLLYVVWVFRPSASSAQVLP